MDILTLTESVKLPIKHRKGLCCQVGLRVRVKTVIIAPTIFCLSCRQIFYYTLNIQIHNKNEK